MYQVRCWKLMVGGLDRKIPARQVRERLLAVEKVLNPKTTFQCFVGTRLVNNRLVKLMSTPNVPYWRLLLPWPCCKALGASDLSSAISHVMSTLYIVLCITFSFLEFYFLRRANFKRVDDLAGPLAVGAFSRQLKIIISRETKKFDGSLIFDYGAFNARNYFAFKTALRRFDALICYIGTAVLRDDLTPTYGIFYPQQVKVFVEFDFVRLSWLRAGYQTIDFAGKHLINVRRHQKSILRPPSTKPKIIFFDLPPVAGYEGVGIVHDFGLGTLQAATLALQKVIAHCVTNSIDLIVKTKRPIGWSYGCREYQEMLSQASEVKGVEVVATGSFFDTVCANSVVIGTPPTSVPLLAKELGIEAFYFDPYGEMEKALSALYGIPVKSRLG